MNVVRSYSNEGKTLQELMEILLPIYLQEKTCNKEIEELEFKTQNPKYRFKIDMSHVQWKINIEREYQKWYCLNDQK